MQFPWKTNLIKLLLQCDEINYTFRENKRQHKRGRVGANDCWPDPILTMRFVVGAFYQTQNFDQRETKKSFNLFFSEKSRRDKFTEILALKLHQIFSKLFRSFFLPNSITRNLRRVINILDYFVFS